MPEPAKRSRNEEPVKSPNTAKTDSLILSIAGLIFKSPSGILTIRPTKTPPVIRIGLPVFEPEFTPDLSVEVTGFDIGTLVVLFLASAQSKLELHKAVFQIDA